MKIKPEKNQTSFNSIPELELASQLNTFYNPFNVHDFSESLSNFTKEVHEKNSLRVDQGPIVPV